MQASLEVPLICDYLKHPLDSRQGEGSLRNIGDFSKQIIIFAI